MMQSLLEQPGFGWGISTFHESCIEFRCFCFTTNNTKNIDWYSNKSEEKKHALAYMLSWNLSVKMSNSDENEPCQDHALMHTLQFFIAFVLR